MSPKTAFLVTIIIGVVWFCYGIFQPTWTELGVGAAIAGVGVIGHEFFRYDQ